MSVPVYPAYKDSGVEWLGEVPAHWSLESLRGQFVELKTKNEGALDQNYLSLVAGRGVMPYAEKGDIGNKKPDDLEKCKVVRSGNFVINSMNFGIGAFGVSAHDGVCSPVYIVLHARELSSLQFLRWIFDNPGFREEAQSFGNGILAHRSAIGWDELKAMKIGVPPIAEQAAIAAFLDRETGKIDALVEEQRRLIALLKEKRQAVISHAVTKGLNPQAPLKASCIEWLGDIPAHWAVVPLKYLAHFSGGGTPSREVPAYWNGDIPWVSPKDMKVELISDTEEFITDDGLEGSASSLVAPGAVLVVVRSGILRHTIPVAINTRAVALNQDMKAISVAQDRYRGDYLSRFIQGLNSTLLPMWLKLGATVESIEFSYMAETPLPVPPLTEQAVISAFLDQETGKFDALVQEADRAILLLQERRAALISAAVTGKIDVRGLADATAAAEAA